MVMSPLDAPVLVPVPGYHEQLRSHLEATEPELWAWFVETVEPPEAAVQAAELELLKTAYRLDGDSHQVLCAYAVLLAGRLRLDHEVTLYQELNETGRNALVQIFGDAVHIVFSGDLLDLLTPTEQQAVLAHELAHVSLLTQAGGVYRVLDNLVQRLADEPGRHLAIEETARRLRLHTEIYADAVAAQLLADAEEADDSGNSNSGSHNSGIDDLVSAVVKVQSGLRNVDPVAYLRQSEEILAVDDSPTTGWTHPELHLRIACLAANAAGGVEGADPKLIRSIVEGPDDLDRVDLLGQLRLQELTARVLASGRALVEPTTSIDTHLATFIGLATRTPEPPPSIGAGPPTTIEDDELAQAEPSVRFLAAALLVDLSFVADEPPSSGPADGPDASQLSDLRALGAEAERMGVATEFDRIVSKATERTLAEVRRLRRPVR